MFKYAFNMHIYMYRQIINEFKYVSTDKDVWKKVQ